MSDKKQNEGGFGKFLYNGDTGEVLGRTGSSWAKILIFYVIFYLGLAAFFGLMLYVFYFTLTDERPKYLLDDSLIGSNPGVGFRPQPDQDKNVDSTLIWFKQSDPKDASFWGDQLKEYLEKTHNATGTPCKFGDKNSQDPNTVCKVDITKLGPCGTNYGNNFGYSDGNPCILLKLNKIFDWEPIGFGYLNENNISQWEDVVKSRKIPEILFNDMKRELSGKPDAIKAQMYSSVWIHCEGENPADKENMGKITYIPERFIAKYYYPFKMQRGYVSPFIMVQFAKVNPGVVVNIECKAFAENIHPDRASRTGSVHFEIMVET